MTDQIDIEALKRRLRYGEEYGDNHVAVAALAQLQAENAELKKKVAEMEKQNYRLTDAVQAAKKYRDNYLLDEIDEPELCLNDEEHKTLVSFSGYIDAAMSQSTAKEGE